MSQKKVNLMLYQKRNLLKKNRHPSHLVKKKKSAFAHLRQKENKAKNYSFSIPKDHRSQKSDSRVHSLPIARRTKHKTLKSNPLP
jgi:hypothetical protein